MRALLKLSGEFLAGPRGFGFDYATIDRITNEMIEIKNLGIELGVVIGGGNFFRGVNSSKIGIEKIVGDDIGMLATIQNALMITGVLQKKSCPCRLFSVIQMDKIAELYRPKIANKALEEKNICFFAGGMGSPFFTTDTASILRAIETNSDCILKGTNVDGIYNCDPNKNKGAKLYKSITFDQVLEQNLKIMDSTAFSLAKENAKNIIVFNIEKKGNLKKVLLNKNIGSLVTN